MASDLNEIKVESMTEINWFIGLPKRVPVGKTFEVRQLRGAVEQRSARTRQLECQAEGRETFPNRPGEKTEAGAPCVGSFAMTQGRSRKEQWDPQQRKWDQIEDYFLASHPSKNPKREIRWRPKGGLCITFYYNHKFYEKLRNFSYK